MQLTPNFELSEFTVTTTRKPNVPNEMAKDNIRYVACRLQYVRDAIGIPIVVDSGFRSDIVNRLVGGSPTSLHLKGLAVDIRTDNIPYKVFPKFLQALLDTKPYEIHVNSHAMLHVSWHPDRDKLIQDDFTI